MAKAFCSAVALLVSLLNSASYAYADVYEYVYNNNSTGAVGNGLFQATLAGIGSGITGNLGNFTGDITVGGFTFAVSSSSFGFLSAGSGEVQLFAGSSSYSAVGTPTGSSSSFFSVGSPSSGLFSAFDAFPSSGGGGGSGGAPAPEVNALLGLALASGTVAFLRRKRTASHACP